MKTLELSSAPKVKIIVDGVEYLAKKIKVSAAIKLEEALEEAKKSGASATSAVLDVLVECGIPREVLLDLEVEALMAISEVLSPEKKS